MVGIALLPRLFAVVPSRRRRARADCCAGLVGSAVDATPGTIGPGGRIRSRPHRRRTRLDHEVVVIIGCDGDMRKLLSSDTLRILPRVRYRESVHYTGRRRIAHRCRRICKHQTAPVQPEIRTSKGCPTAARSNAHPPPIGRIAPPGGVDLRGGAPRPCAEQVDHVKVFAHRIDESLTADDAHATRTPRRARPSSREHERSSDRASMT